MAWTLHTCSVTMSPKSSFFIESRGSITTELWIMWFCCQSLVQSVKVDFWNTPSGLFVLSGGCGPAATATTALQLQLFTNRQEQWKERKLYFWYHFHLLQLHWQLRLYVTKTGRAYGYHVGYFVTTFNVRPMMYSFVCGTLSLSVYIYSFEYLSFMVSLDKETQ